MTKEHNKNSLIPLAKGRLIRHLACAEFQLRIILRADFSSYFATQAEYNAHKQKLGELYQAINNSADNLKRLKHHLKAALYEDT